MEYPTARLEKNPCSTCIPFHYDVHGGEHQEDRSEGYSAQLARHERDRDSQPQRRADRDVDGYSDWAAYRFLPSGYTTQRFSPVGMMSSCKPARKRYGSIQQSSRLC
eukprot:1387792-Amorphochlora_amoeboformis.AAC.1